MYKEIWFCSGSDGKAQNMDLGSMDPLCGPGPFLSTGYIDLLFLLALKLVWSDIMSSLYACDITKIAVCCWNHYVGEQLKIYR